MTNQDINKWLGLEEEKNGYIRKALENASTVFDDKDAFTVNTLQAIYGQESSFGEQRKVKEKGVDNPAGHFQLTADIVKKYSKTKITKKNDIRYDVDNASNLATQYLADLNQLFSQDSILITPTATSQGRFTTAILNINERKLFAIASYTNSINKYHIITKDF